jgi:hypothetical protein
MHKIKNRQALVTYNHYDQYYTVLVLVNTYKTITYGIPRHSPVIYAGYRINYRNLCRLKPYQYHI